MLRQGASYDVLASVFWVVLGLVNVKHCTGAAVQMNKELREGRADWIPMATEDQWIYSGSASIGKIIIPKSKCFVPIVLKLWLFEIESNNGSIVIL